MSAPRILVVEDDASLRLTLVANLELEGLEVVEARDAEEALRRLEDVRVDLMLTDIRMPGMDGVELFRHVKRTRPGLPVVLMSAFVGERVDDALAEGAFTVLPKPYDVNHLLETVLRAVCSPEVLVVDDMEATADSTVDALRAVGLRARAVYDGEAALASARTGAFDVCVLDLMMPGVSGPEVVERMRASRLPVAVIAVSAYASQELMGRAAAQGAVSCMHKPMELRELVQSIARVRGQPRLTR